MFVKIQIIVIGHSNGFELFCCVLVLLLLLCVRAPAYMYIFLSMIIDVLFMMFLKIQIVVIGLDWVGFFLIAVWFIFSCFFLAFDLYICFAEIHGHEACACFEFENVLLILNYMYLGNNLFFPIGFRVFRVYLCFQDIDSRDQVIGVSRVIFQEWNSNLLNRTSS